MGLLGRVGSLIAPSYVDQYATNLKLLLELSLTPSASFLFSSIIDLVHYSASERDKNKQNSFAGSLITATAAHTQRKDGRYRPLVDNILLMSFLSSSSSSSSSLKTVYLFVVTQTFDRP